MQHDKFHDVTKNPGYIYVLTNRTYFNVVKIGKTTRLPGYRAVELSKSSGVPQPFNMEYSRFVEKDLDLVEARILTQLAKYRINNSREFFKLPVTEAAKKIDQVIDDFFSYRSQGITYRHAQHARWGYLFEFIDLPFEYLTEPVKLGEENSFLVDFWLPEQNCYMIISQDLLSTKIGRMAASFFAEKTGKVLLVFWDCQPGIERRDDTGDLVFHTGWSVTPEAEIDGAIEFGICVRCGSRHVGHLGSAELCDSKSRNTSPVHCQCFSPETHIHLLRGYGIVGHVFDRIVI
jgi:hypothetical protein